ncbi:MAG TPA: UbiA prenyltransferase family protein, partial [Ktedonobacterales bacterium]|nr:UbiA prenyltransferase family protein [Ktedonobacterales bacterium]
MSRGLRSPTVMDEHLRSGQRTPAAPDGAQAAGKHVVARGWATAWAALRAMRPEQWTKNGLTLLAAVFSRTIFDGPTLTRVVIGFAAFCLAASGVYIVNDLADRHRDQLHPRKRYRPIASGALSPLAARWLAVALFAGAGALAIWLAQGGLYHDLPRGPDPFRAYGGGGLLFELALVAYVLLNFAYSGWLKRLALWDVFAIAAGFVLRALGGAFAAAVYISPWFYLCAIFLSLFLALGKRRAELARIGEQPASGGARESVLLYTTQLLDQLILLSVTCAVIAYSLYTFQGEVGGQAFIFTVPIVLFGVCRYLYLIYVRREGERPD